MPRRVPFHSPQKIAELFIRTQSMVCISWIVNYISWYTDIWSSLRFHIHNDGSALKARTVNKTSSTDEICTLIGWIRSAMDPHPYQIDSRNWILSIYCYWKNECHVCRQIPGTISRGTI